MIDLVEAKIDLNASQGQKNVYAKPDVLDLLQASNNTNESHQQESNTAPLRKPSVYSEFLKHYSFNTGKVLECPVCGQKYKTHVMNEHLLSHTVQELICFKCKISFTERSYLYNHFTLSHSSVKPFECSLCDHDFKSKKLILHHLRTAHGLKYRCFQCNLEFESLTDHNPEKCKILDSKFKSSALLKEAVCSEAQDDVSLHKRKEMSTEVLEVTEVQLKKKRKDTLDVVEAEIDLKEFQGQKSRKRRSRIIPAAHSDFLKNYSFNTKAFIKCPVCKEVYKPRAFEKHFHTHVVKDPFCTKCEKTFKNQTSYYRHYVTRHNSVKSFECSLCKYSTKLKYIILDHLRTRHGIKYKCPQCYLKFRSSKEHNVRQCIIQKLGSSSLLSSIPSKNRQIMPSVKHSPKASHLNNRHEVTTEDTGLMEAESSGTQKDDVSFNERGETSTGCSLTEAVQQKQKEEEIDPNKSEEQKRSNSATCRTPSMFWDFLEKFSVDTETLHECPICEERYKPHLLRDHFHLHNVKDLVCRVCNKTFEYPYMFYNHYFERHSSVRPFECLLCDKSFPLKKGIISHLKISHDIKYKCPYCNLKFKYLHEHKMKKCRFIVSRLKKKAATEDSQSQLPLKKRKYTKKTEKQMYSNLQNSASKDIHVKSSGSQVNDVLQSTSMHDYADKQKEMPETGIHVNESMPTVFNHLNGGKRSAEFLGTADGQSLFPLKGIHSNIHNLIETEINQNRCQGQKCRITPGEENFAFSEFLRYYCINTKTFQTCPICLETCTPLTIYKHLYSHEGTEPICALCRMMFRTQSDLHIHYLTYHNSLEPFECLICRKSFKLRIFVLNHLRTEHEIKYRCPQCNIETLSIMNHFTNCSSSFARYPSNISAHEQLRECENIERECCVKSVIVSDIKEDTVSHNARIKDTNFNDIDYLEEAMIVHKQGEIVLQQNTVDAALMEAGDKERYGLTVKEDMITDLPLNLFINLDEQRTAYSYSADTLECLENVNRYNCKEFTLQKSTRNGYNSGIVNGYDEEYALVIEQEAYFVSLWMSEDTVC